MGGAPQPLSETCRPDCPREEENPQAWCLYFSNSGNSNRNHTGLHDSDFQNKNNIIKNIRNNIYNYLENNNIYCQALSVCPPGICYTKLRALYTGSFSFPSRLLYEGVPTAVPVLWAQAAGPRP